MSVLNYKTIFALILSILTAFAFNRSLNQGITNVIFVAFLFVLYKKTLLSSESDVFGKAKIRISSLLFSIMLSVALLIGESFRVFGNFGFITANAFQVLLNLVIMLGYTVFFYTIVEIALFYLNKFVARNKGLSSEFGTSHAGFSNLLLERKPFLFPAIALMLFWLPVWLVYMPGTLTWDGADQLVQFLGELRWSDHHPVFGSMVYGYLFSIGRLFGSDNLGIFFIVLFQMVLFSSAFAFCLSKAKQWGIPQKARFLMFLFFALNPIFPFQIIAVIKDTPSTALMMFFFVLYIDLLRDIRIGKQGAKRHFLRLAGIIGIGVLASLIRHNNLYVVVISIAVFVFLKQNVKFRIAAIAAAMICFIGANLISGALSNSVGAERGSIAEALSVPFQQTARFVRDHPELVTEEERAAIDAILPFEYLNWLYTPYLSDPVKGQFRGDTAELITYFRHWFNMGMRRPATYLAATIANSYSYFMPVKYTPHEWGHAWIHHHFGPLYVYDIPLDTFSLRDTRAQPQRQIVAEFYESFRNLPGINLFFQLAHYTWFLLFLMLFLLRRKRRRDIIAFVPALLVILTCIASPVNGYVRYFLPVITFMPLLTIWSVYNLHEKEEVYE